MVAVEKPTKSAAATNAAGVPPWKRRVNEFVAETLVIPPVVTEVDNPTLIILSREKFVIHGIPGSVA